MNTYKNLKLIINHTNEQYKSGEIDAKEYKNFKTETLKKMDTFLLCNRFSNDKYEELFAIFIADEESTVEEISEE